MHSLDLIGSASVLRVDFDWIAQIITLTQAPALDYIRFFTQETGTQMTQASSQIMGFSPKVLVALIALGLGSHRKYCF